MIVLNTEVIEKIESETGGTVYIRQIFADTKVYVIWNISDYQVEYREIVIFEKDFSVDDFIKAANQVKQKKIKQMQKELQRLLSVKVLNG